MSSGYLQRLLDRAAPSAPTAPAAGAPGEAARVRPGGTSGSPLAAADQRLHDPGMARALWRTGSPAGPGIGETVDEVVDRGPGSEPGTGGAANDAPSPVPTAARPDASDDAWSRVRALAEGFLSGIQPADLVRREDIETGALPGSVERPAAEREPADHERSTRARPTPAPPGNTGDDTTRPATARPVASPAEGTERARESAHAKARRIEERIVERRETVEAPPKALPSPRNVDASPPPQPVAPIAPAESREQDDHPVRVRPPVPEPRAPDPRGAETAVAAAGAAEASTAANGKRDRAASERAARETSRAPGRERPTPRVPRSAAEASVIGPLQPRSRVRTVLGRRWR